MIFFNTYAYVVLKMSTIPYWQTYTDIFNRRVFETTATETLPDVSATDLDNVYNKTTENINEIKKLNPKNIVELNSIPLLIRPTTSKFSGYQCSTGTLKDNVYALLSIEFGYTELFGNSKITSTVTGEFTRYSGVNFDVQDEIIDDSISLPLSFGFTEETNGILSIKTEDPYADISGSENILQALRAKLTKIGLTENRRYEAMLYHDYVVDSYQSSAPVDFIVDALTGIPINNSLSINLSNCVINAPRYVSGVKVWNTTDVISFQVSISNVISYFYNKDMIYSITSSITEYKHGYLPSGTTIADKTNPLIYPSILCIVNVTNKYTESVNITLKSRNPEGVETTTVYNLPIYIDSVSNESLRLSSGGSSLYPTTFGNVFDSSISLTTNFELQLSNGLYQYPMPRNYETLYTYPTTNVDYTTIDNSFVRWACFKLGTINIQPYVDIEITGSSYTDSDDVIMSGLYLFVTVNKTNKWIDANKGYENVAIPLKHTSHGAGSLVLYASTKKRRRITFGAMLATGDLYVRIGFNGTNNYTFSKIELIQ